MARKHKNYLIVSVIAAIGVFLIILGSINSNKKQNSTEELYENYTIGLEKKIEDFLLNVDGITNVKVIVTLDIPNENAQGNDIFASTNSDNTYLEAIPSVKGVAIACTNGDNYEVKMCITSLISAYLGISSNRIEIVGIK